MRSAFVVPAQVAGEGTGALAAAGVAARVGPFAEQGLDQAFGLAVGAWPVGAGVAALDPCAAGRFDPGVRVVGLGVVGQHPLEPLGGPKVKRDPLPGGARNGSPLPDREWLGQAMTISDFISDREFPSMTTVSACTVGRGTAKDPWLPCIASNRR